MNSFTLVYVRDNIEYFIELVCSTEQHIGDGQILLYKVIKELVIKKIPKLKLFSLPELCLVNWY